MKVPFTYYLHDDSESWWEAVQDALTEAGVNVDEAERICQRAQRPFYEITYNCELDTETGRVEIVSER